MTSSQTPRSQESRQRLGLSAYYCSLRFVIGKVEIQVACNFLTATRVGIMRLAVPDLPGFDPEKAGLENADRDVTPKRK